MNINHYAAAAARRVKDARSDLENPPAVDAIAWDALLREVRDHYRRGDTARAEALIDSWEHYEIERLTEVPA